MPGAPAQGKCDEPMGCWSLSLKSMARTVRAAVFYHCCMAFCTYSDTKAFWALLEEDRISFYGPEALQARIRIALSTVQLPGMPLDWRWTTTTSLCIPVSAQWIPITYITTGSSS